MNLDPVSLKLFIQIVETGTIAGGAKRLNIVTSAASKRIVELEEILETQLLRRTNRGVEATAAGAELERLAKHAVGELDDIARRIQGFATGIRGHVRIFVNAAAVTEAVPRQLAAFLKTHPDVFVHLEERSSDAIFKGVAENLADIGISFAAQAQQSYALESVPYRQYRLVLLVPKAHQLAKRRTVQFAGTLEYQHIGLQVGSATNLYMNSQAAKLGRRIDYRMYVESFHAMALLIEAGLGIGIAPIGLLQPFSRSFGIRAVALDEPWALRDLQIYFSSSARLQTATRLIVDQLRKKE